MKSKAPLMLGITCLIVSGCIYLPWFERGRVTVVTENVSIAKVPNDVLFGKSSRLPGTAQFSEVVQFDLSSDTDLLDYFANRAIQIRCRLDGDMNIRWSNFGYGPFYEGTDLSVLAMDRKKFALSPRTHDGRYSYTVYAFKDLNAGWLENGTTSRDAPLETLQFSQISCYIIGVAKAPVSFPQSTNFSLSREQYMMLIKERNVHRK
jgi:hypothetical protein